jgi:hypothetical protein
LIVQVLGEQSDGAGALGDRSAAWPEPR